jgi:hypothetical protein
VVQIHSPRLLRLEPAVYGHRDGRGAPGRGPGCRYFKSISDDDSFPAQINALRCIFICEFCFHFTDNTDNCCSFVRNFGSPVP